MSTIQIDVQVKTNKAASDVDKLEQKLRDLKFSQTVPLRLQTEEAESKIGKLKGSLQGLKQNLSSGAAAGGGQALVGVLSQQANELSHGLDGASKSAADFGIAAGVAAASAMGPWGLLAAGIVGVIGLLVRLEREERETEVATARLAEVHNRLSTASTEAAGATTNQANAQERLNAAIIAGRGLLASQANMLGQGFNQSQIDNFRQAIENVLPTIRASNGVLTENVTVQQVLDAVINRNSGQLSQWGINMQFAENQQVNVANATEHMTNAVINNASAERDRAQLILQAAAIEMRRAEDNWRNNRHNTAAQELLERSRASYTTANNAAIASERALNEALQVGIGVIGQSAQEMREHAQATAAAALAETKAGDALAAMKFRTASGNAASAASAADMRTARRQIEDARLQARRLESDIAMRNSTDAKLRTTQEFRNATAAETFRREQESRQIEIARAEEDAARTRRQTGENEAQRLTRIATAQATVNRLRREGIDAADAETARINAQSEAERVAEDARRERFRTTALLMQQQRQQAIETQNNLRAAVQATRQAALDGAEAVVQNLRNSQQALQNLNQQNTANRERLNLAQSLGATESELNTIRSEGNQIQINAQNAQTAVANNLKEQERTFGSLASIAKSSSETIVSGLTESAAAAIFAGESIGAALHKALVSTMQNIATESAVRSMVELAKGLASLAVGGAAAPLHFASAAKFGVAAVLAGGIALATAPSNSPAGGAATSAATRPETPTRRDEEEGRGAPKNISISINAFQNSDQAQQLIVRSLREAGYSGRR